MKDGSLRNFISGICFGICIIFVIETLVPKKESEKFVAQERSIFAPIQNDGIYACMVTKIVDGDTVDVDFKVWSDVTLSKRIRFLNFDAWESRGEEKEMGNKATLFLTNLLEGYPVFLKSDGSTGKYGRTLGSLYVMKDGELVSVSEEMIKNGHQKVTKEINP